VCSKRGSERGDGLVEVEPQRCSVGALLPGVDAAGKLQPLQDLLDDHGERQNGADAVAAVE